MTTKFFYVYIVSNFRHGTVYTGVTSNLQRRILEHKQGLLEGFTKKYGTTRLVYYEAFTDWYQAFSREKRLKRWNRSWKEALIEKQNPSWRDLYFEVFQP